MLRNVLIVFGWIIPLVSLLLIAVEIFSAVQLRTFGTSNQPDLWISIVRSIAHGIQSLTLSPLCFFGAYMMGRPREIG